MSGSMLAAALLNVHHFLTDCSIGLWLIKEGDPENTPVRKRSTKSKNHPEDTHERRILTRPWTYGWHTDFDDAAFMI